MQYYLEKNLDARERELEREAELDSKAPKVKAKSKMSKVNFCWTIFNTVTTKYTDSEINTIIKQLFLSNISF